MEDTMKSKDYGTLQRMDDEDLELVANDSDHPLSELATEILNERQSADSDPRVAQALGYSGNEDYFSIPSRI